MAVYDDWAAFVDFAAGATSGTGPLVETDLRCPVPAPRQVFAIGLNYRRHAEESGMAIPAVPATFTKFPARSPGPSMTSRSSPSCRPCGRCCGSGGRGRDTESSADDVPGHVERRGVVA